MVSIRIPTPLRHLAGGEGEVSVQGATLAAALESLEQAHPGFRERLLNEKGAIRPYINIFLNDDDVRYGDGLDTELSDGDKLSIVPAIAGGR